MARCGLLLLLLLALGACSYVPLAGAHTSNTGIAPFKPEVAPAQAYVFGADGGPKDRACEICQEVASQAALVLADPQTTQQAMAILEGVLCTQLPGGLMQKCTAMVEEYVPQAMLVLLDVVNPDTLCVRTMICEADQLLSAEAASSLTTLDALPRCDICRQVAAQVLILIENGKTQEQITAALLKACQRLRGPGLSEKCGEVVEVYVPELLALVGTVTPDEFCKLAKYCPGRSQLDGSLGGELATTSFRGSAVARMDDLEVSEEVGIRNPQECAACRLLVNQAKKKLKDPANQVKVAVFFTDLCNKVEKYKEQCAAAVAEYLPQFFANIDKYLDPAKVCKQAKLCSVSPSIELPTSGQLPSY